MYMPLKSLIDSKPVLNTRFDAVVLAVDASTARRPAVAFAEHAANRPINASERNALIRTPAPPRQRYATPRQNRTQIEQLITGQDPFADDPPQCPHLARIDAGRFG